MGEDQIHTLPDGIAPALQGLEPVLGVKGLHGAGPCPAEGDLPGDREDRLGLDFDEILDGVVALGDPRAAVEQAGGVEEGAEVHFDWRAAKGRQACHRGLEQSGVVRVAEVVQLLRARHAEAEGLAGRKAAAMGFHRTAVGVCFIEAAGHGEHRGRVGGAEGENRYRVDAPAGGHQAGGGEQAAGGLEADQIVEGRRHAARAGGVGAEGEADLCGGHRHGRAGAGAAGDEGRVDGVAAGAVGAAGAVEAGGELIQVGLAEGDGAGGDQPGHHPGIGGGQVGEVRTAGSGGQASQIDVVLDGEGDAVQGQAGRVLLVQGAGAGQQLGLG